MRIGFAKGKEREKKKGRTLSFSLWTLPFTFHSTSPEMQALYDRCNHVAGDQVERFIQRNVLKRHGFTPSVENLAEFWKIRAKYGDDDREVMESVIYLRYAHLLHECTIPLGAAAPDATLVTMDQVARCFFRFFFLSHCWATETLPTFRLHAAA